MGARKSRSCCRWFVAATIALSSSVLLSTAAAADGPDWSNTRTLDCGSAGLLEAVLPPAGFGTAFHLVDGTSVITPKWVEVLFPGATEWIVTYDKPGYATSEVRTIDCRYTDPIGLQVHFIGHITPAAG